MDRPAPQLDDQTLADVQGIVTTGYGHLPEVAYVFVNIERAETGQAWINRLMSCITSSAPWPMGGDGRVIKPSVAVDLTFTADGLRALGLPGEVLRTFPPEFQEGIAARSQILGDTDMSAPEQWEFGGPATPSVHAVLLLFAGDAVALEDLCRLQREMMDDSGVTLAAGVQYGYRPGSESEPFGFRDGMGQPRIAGLEGSGVPTGEFILGYENHYGLIPPTPVVARELDPTESLTAFANPYYAEKGLRDLGRNGSYMVYRKLQQDVAGFWQFMRHEAARHVEATDDRMIWLASKCIGRWPSGTSLMLSPDHDNQTLGNRDDFLYADDAEGLRCPLGAHVRRTNPRDVLKPYPVPQSLSMTEAHRLLRRGRVYGPPLFDAASLHRGSPDRAPLADIRDDGQLRGIHFVALNASLKSQFEFVQQTWCNNPHFGGLTDNTDPLLTMRRADDDPPTRMTIPVASGTVRTAPLPNFVTVKAGAYLFVPSLTAVRFLASVGGKTVARR